MGKSKYFDRKNLRIFSNYNIYCFADYLLLIHLQRHKSLNKCFINFIYTIYIYEYLYTNSILMKYVYIYVKFDLFRCYLIIIFFLSDKIQVSYIDWQVLFELTRTIIFFITSIDTMREKPQFVSLSIF